MAVSSNADASRFRATYVKAAWSCARVRCSDISTNEAISMTSNQTYRLKMSPVRNAPETPISSTWTSA